MVESIISGLRELNIFLRLEDDRLICDAPRGALTPELARYIQLNKAQIVHHLRESQGAAALALPDNAIPPAARDRPLPLSYFQESLWFLEQLNPNTPAYNISLKISVPVALDAAILGRCLDEIVRRHEALRTSFKIRQGIPYQEVQPPSPVAIAVRDLSAVLAEERALQAESWCADQAKKVFSLQLGLLLRAALARLGDAGTLLLITVHHLVSDGTSVDLLVSELFTLYDAFGKGQTSPLPELPIQYADFAVWQRERETGEDIQRQMAYWRKQMTNAPTALDMPVDRTAYSARSAGASVAILTITEDLTARVRSLARNVRASTSMVMLAAFQVLLYRYSGQSDVVVGVPISGRERQEVENLIGLFVNTLPLRLELAGNPLFSEVLSQVRENLLEAHRNQDIPFGRLVRELRPARAAERNPFFETLFTFRDRTAVRTTDVSSEIVSTESAKFDLSLSVDEYSDVMRSELEYRTDVLRRERAEGILASLIRILEVVTTTPGTRVNEVSLLDPASQAKVLALGSGRKADLTSHRMVDQLIFDGASRYPEREAIRFGAESLSYRQLSERVDEVVSYLDAVNAGPDKVIALCAERSLELVIGLLAILKSGAAFLPLDPYFPHERLRYMLNDAQPAAVLFAGAAGEGLEMGDTPRIFLDDLRLSKIERSSERRSAPPRRPDHLAYVIYTSGSTGAPKGVEVPHLALLNFLFFMREQFKFGATDAWLAVTTVSFDISILELLLPLLCGGRVVLASRDQTSDPVELIRIIDSHRISFMQATPTTWRLMLAADWAGSVNLRILCGGEPWSDDLASALLPRCHSLWNMYGPTETTIWSAVKRILPGDKVLIGAPIDNTDLYVLGDDQTLQPIDVPGELYIGGAGLARGYRGRPDLTVERFLRNPFSSEPGGRMYKTGDRVRRLPNGDLEFLGRLDNQVKIRGYRIELDEVAAVIRSCPGVAEAVVVLHGKDDAKNLVGYFTTSTAERPEVKELSNFLRQKLPTYMVPPFLEQLETFATTPNGKIDRKWLEAREPKVAARAAAKVAPRTAVEQVIAQTWSKLLRITDIGVDDDFFELGAHSMMVIQAIDELNRSSGMQIGVAEVFEHRTVSSLARFIEARKEDRWAPRVVQLSEGGPNSPIYFIYAGPAELAVAHSIGSDFAVFGIEVPWPIEWKDAVINNEREKYPNIDTIVDLFYEEFRKHLTADSCVVAGYSFAGLLAFEVARRHLEGGGKVDAVVIVDKWLSYPSIASAAMKSLRGCWANDWRTDGPTRLSDRVTRSGLIIRWAAESVAKRLGSTVWLHPNELTSFLDQKGQPLRWKFVERLYVEVERFYNPKPINTRGIIIRPEFLDRYHSIQTQNHYLGWDVLFTRGAKAFTIAGDHFSMVREHSKILGQLLHKAIKDVVGAQS